MPFCMVANLAQFEDWGWCGGRAGVGEVVLSSCKSTFPPGLGLFGFSLALSTPLKVKQLQTWTSGVPSPQQRRQETHTQQWETDMYELVFQPFTQLLEI